MGYSSSQFMSFGGQGQNEVGTSAEALAAATDDATAVVIKAHPDNTDVVYFNMDGVAATPANGYPLSAGQDSPWLPVPGKNLANISVIADAAAQDIAFIYVT